MPSDKVSNYVLASGTDEMQRLRLQAQVWEPAATDFLSELDISPGSRVLDLGCGAMGVLEPLSRLVGEQGTVSAIHSYTNSAPTGAGAAHSQTGG